MSKSQVEGSRNKRDWEKALSAQQFDFEARTDRAEREGTTVQLGQPERAGMELPALMTNCHKAEIHMSQTTLLTESEPEELFTETANHRN